MYFGILSVWWWFTCYTPVYGFGDSHWGGFLNLTLSRSNPWEKNDLGVKLKPKKELIFFDMTYELIEREKLKANDEDLFKNKKGELSKLSRLRIVMHLISAISWTWVTAWVTTYESYLMIHNIKRLKIYRLLEVPQSSTAAFCFSIGIQILIIFSVLVFILER